MISSRRSWGGARASFSHLSVPRAEQRAGEGGRPYLAFLVRLSSELGEYPSPHAYYELRYSQLTALHAHLREEYGGMGLAWLPRMRWLGARHPKYLSELCASIQSYLTHTLHAWVRYTGRIDGFIVLLHCLHEAGEGVVSLPRREQLPPPATEQALMREGRDGREVREGREVKEGSEGGREGDSTRTQEPSPRRSYAQPIADREALNWRSYQAMRSSPSSIHCCSTDSTPSHTPSPPQPSP